MPPAPLPPHAGPARGRSAGHPYLFLTLALLACFALVVAIIVGLDSGWFGVSVGLDQGSPVHGHAARLFRLCFPPALAVALLALVGLRRVLRDLFPGAPRVASVAVSLAALAYALFLAHGFAADAPHFSQLGLGYSLTALPWAVSIALFGIAARLRLLLPRCVLRALAALLALAVLALVLAEWYLCGPLHQRFRVATVGTPPRTVVLSYAWSGWKGGLYDIRLYVRDAPDAPWEAWLADFWGWPSGSGTSVEFSFDGIPLLSDRYGNGFVLRRPADRPEPDGKFLPWPIPPGDQTYPSTLSPAELHAIHQTLCRQP